MGKPLAIVAGAGPGLGRALVTHLNNSGFTAVGLNRSAPADAPNGILACDLTDAAATADAIAALISKHGAPKAVIHNPAKLLIRPFADTSANDFETLWRTMVLSATHLARSVLPVMAAASEGAFIVSGATASLRGGANFSAFASAKAGLRALTQSIAREYGLKGVHVAHVILDGILDTEMSRVLHRLESERMMSLDDVAAAYLGLIRQPSSAWTHELDLRPMGEAF